MHGRWTVGTESAVPSRALCGQLSSQLSILMKFLLEGADEILETVDVLLNLVFGSEGSL